MRLSIGEEEKGGYESLMLRFRGGATETASGTETGQDGLSPGRAETKPDVSRDETPRRLWTPNGLAVPQLR